MRTYLVTGGAGFYRFKLHSLYVEKIWDAIRIINVDKLTYAGNLENLKDMKTERIIRL